MLDSYSRDILQYISTLPYSIDMSFPIPYVRFTPFEFSQVKRLKIHDTFNHVNLHHNGSDISLGKSKYQIGVKIVKGGRYIDSKNMHPVLDMNDLLLLELVDMEEEIEMGVERECNNLLIMPNMNIKEYILFKYTKVMDISEKDLSSMKYYLRTFRILKRFNLR